MLLLLFCAFMISVHLPVIWAQGAKVDVGAGRATFSGLRRKTEFIRTLVAAAFKCTAL